MTKRTGTFDFSENLPHLIRWRIFNLLGPMELISFYLTSSTAKKLIPSHHFQSVSVDIHLQLNGPLVIKATSTSSQMTSLLKTFDDFINLFDHFNHVKMGEIHVELGKKKDQRHLKDFQHLLNCFDNSKCEFLKIYSPDDVEAIDNDEFYEVYYLLDPKRIEVDARFGCIWDIFEPNFDEMEEVVLHYGEWVLSHNLTDFKCKKAILSDTFMNDYSFNIFLKFWQEGGGKQWKYLEIEAGGPPDNEHWDQWPHDEEGIEYLLAELKVSPTRHFKECVVIDGGKRRIPLWGGFDISREDQSQEATFVKIYDKFYFFVWN